MADKRTPKQRMTLEERREALERQMKDLEILSKIDEELAEIAKDYDKRALDACTYSVEDGYETEQDKRWDGELLWEYKDEKGYTRYITKADYEAKGLTEADVKPHYARKYRQVVTPIEELDDWSKTRAIAYKRIAEFIKTLSADDIPETDAPIEEAKEEEKKEGES